MKDDVLYYSHNEFNPEVSIRHCQAIQLTPTLVYNSPSKLDFPQIQSHKSIDLQLGDRMITFVADDKFPNSSSFLVTVVVLVCCDF